MNLVNISGASFSYGSHLVLDQIDLDISPGEVLCIIGPNGCGKTTLLDCILGIKQLQKGQIFLEGEKLNKLKPYQIAKKIAYVPQAHEKTFPFSVLDIVLMGRAAYTEIFSSPSREDRRICMDALEDVGMAHYCDRPYTQLSGGEAQLVMLARALSQKTNVILMDEPTSHLDFKHELMILETMVKLVRTMNISIIMATHFPNHALYFENNQIQTKVALMKNKKFLEIGTPIEVLSESNLRLLYDINAKVVTYQDGDIELRQIVPLSRISEDTPGGN